MENKGSFILYTRYSGYAEKLSDAEFGALMRAIFRYETDRICPEEGGLLSPYAMAIFDIIKCDLDKNREKYDEVRTKKSEAGKKGGRPKKAEKANAFDESKESTCKQEKQKKPVMFCSDMLCDDMNCYDAAEAADNARAREDAAAGKKSGDVFKLYEKLIGSLTPRVAEILDGYSISEELKIKAIEEAHDSGVRNLKYIEAILQGYEKDGVTSIADAERRTAEGKHRKNSTGNKSAEQSKASNYDFDEIERLEFERISKMTEGSDDG